MDELTKWMKEFEDKMISYNEAMLDIINRESPYKIRDVDDILEEKVA